MSADYSGGSSDALSRFFCVNPIDLNRAYPDGGAMSEMRYAYTKILIVTCYLLLVTARLDNLSSMMSTNAV